MSCEKYKDLIEKRLDGTINDEQSAALKNHTEQCQLCRKELARCAQIQEIVKQAFSSQTSAEQASRTILSQITPRTIKPVQLPLFGRRMAVAASILLAIGLLLGFGLARVTTARRTTATTAKVPMKVTQIEGTVLVKHQGADVWRIMQSHSDIHLGDTFHSTANSGFVLELEDESTIEVNQNSMLVLRSYNGETQFFLEHGECTAALESRHGPFFIYTPNGRAEALGTEFTVTVE
ncbi:MAG: FecR domain-containing protein [Phycisphaerales bacterium]|nr:MAG: FecR domain-containing protein [Phycisphaerales bacterium]